MLREGGLLSEENEFLVRRVMAYFQEKRGITLGEAGGASLVTHLCACLQRIGRGEAVSEMAPDVYEDVQSDPNFATAWEISRDIQAICPVMPEAELKYLTLHTCVILAEA